jgi:hypothetical protein
VVLSGVPDPACLGLVAEAGSGPVGLVRSGSSLCRTGP